MKEALDARCWEAEDCWGHTRRLLRKHIIFDSVVDCRIHVNSPQSFVSLFKFIFLVIVGARGGRHTLRCKDRQLIHHSP